MPKSGGVVVMIGPDSLSVLGRGVLAQLAVLAAGMSYACAGIFGRRFAGTPPLVTATGQVTASTVLILPVVYAGESIGGLEAYCKQERPWSRTEINRARIIANQIASVIHSLFLSQKAR